MLSLSPPPSSSSSLPISRARPKPKITENEMDKLRSTIRQLHRDWSKEGENEREKSYRSIVDSLLKYSKQLLEKGEIASMGEFNVLVPG
jgi:carnosine N-methyltransferase